ncbi:hypothetical protein QM565_01305 [Geitlerinema splendidum]|nr:hypothetical protein [Geitlerinema splendidum]
MMNKNNNRTPCSELASAEYLLNRFDKDVQAVYSQMAILQIVFDNLKGSWFAVSSAYNVFKIDTKEES